MKNKKIIEQAVKAWWANYGEGKYDLANNNCEHLANSLVLGIDYSSQIEEKKGRVWTYARSSECRCWDSYWT